MKFVNLLAGVTRKFWSLFFIFAANVQPLFCAKCIDDRLTLFLYSKLFLFSIHIRDYK